MASDCNGECNQSNCPFKTDPFDRYTEVCVKCGKDYSFRRGKFLYFMILWIIAGLLLFANEPFPETDFQPETQPPSQDLPKP